MSFANVQIFQVRLRRLYVFIHDWLHAIADNSYVFANLEKLVRTMSSHSIHLLTPPLAFNAVQGYKEFVNHFNHPSP